jgi:hypothetical protein
MEKIKIESTQENKERQKNSYFNSSSAVFFVNHNPEQSIETEISFLNHFLLKREITDVVVNISLYRINGELVRKSSIELTDPKTYSINPCIGMSEKFLGSVYLEFQSKHNLAVPFCAVVMAIKSKGSVCAVHTYGRRLEYAEIGSKIDLASTKETGWTLRDTESISSFALLHNGRESSELRFSIEIQNTFAEIRKKEFVRTVKPYEATLILPKEIFLDHSEFLAGSLGHAKLTIDGLKGVFPRLLCGNFLGNRKNVFKLTEAQEIQFTHTNFDFDAFSQPDSAYKVSYFNQPHLPVAYAIFYPVKTDKSIQISNVPFVSDRIFVADLTDFTQTKVESTNENLPSRFVGASVGKWKGSQLESECSTGIFVQDYLNVPCHWHWGLFKPGFENGVGVISIHVNNFSCDAFKARDINIKLYDDSGVILDKMIILKSSTLLRDINIDGSVGSVWYVISGEKLEDLNIFSTFYPCNKAGFVEHAF